MAFLSQSGGIANDLSHTGKWMGIGFSKVVSFGNGADLRETDLLRYLTDDPETQVISMYIEGVQDGDAFFRAIKTAAAKKPVIVYKGGLSRAGARTVASHTASLGGSRMIWQSVLKQVNAVQVNDTEELAQSCLAFSLLPQKTFNGISIVGGGGAIGVTACDTAEQYGIDIPPLSAGLQSRIGDFLPKPGSSAINPIDVANPFVPPQVLKEVLNLTAEDKRINLQIIVSLIPHYKPLAQMMGKPVAKVMPYKELAEIVQDVVAETGKPIIAVLPNIKRGLDNLDITKVIALAREQFLQRGIPVYDEIHDAIRALAHVNTYYGGRNHEKR